MVRELIVALDDEARRLAYAVVEGSKRTTCHHASMQVFAEGEDGSRLVWITDFLPHDQAWSIAAIIEKGGRGDEADARVLEASFYVSTSVDLPLQKHRLQMIPLSLKNRYTFIRKHMVLAGTQ